MHRSLLVPHDSAIGHKRDNPELRPKHVIRLKACVLCVTVAIAGAAYVLASRPQMSPSSAKNFVLGTNIAYVLLPPEPVTGSLSDSLLWSSDGSYLLVGRTDSREESTVRSALSGQPRSEPQLQSLIAYRMFDQKNTLLWRANANAARLGEVDWFPDSHRFAASVTESLRTEDPTKPPHSRQSILVFDADKGVSITAMSVVQEGGTPVMSVSMSPTKPYGLLISEAWSHVDAAAAPTQAAGTAVEVVTKVGGPGTSATAPALGPEYWLVRPDGSTKRIIVDQGLGWEGWSSDGSSPTFGRFQRVANSRPIVTLFQVDLATGKLQQIPEPAPRREEPSRQDVYTSLAPANLTGAGTDLRVRSGWLMGSADRSKTMIAADCSLLSLSPTLNAVAYVSNGVALVRPILQLPKKAFLTALEDVLKREAMNNAKQAGLATIMYSGDYDDQLPMKGMTLSDVLGPYARNEGVFDGFNITYTGSSLGDIKDPAHTELGYTSGPGGRAVLYADGHVVWVPDK